MGREQTLLYEIATRDWLAGFSRTLALGRPATLDDVPDESLDELARLGFNWLWLMGVWQTGTIGREVSLSQPEWMKGFRTVLPDFVPEEDVCGSPYAIQEYAVHRDFGGDEALSRLRARLHERGIRLMLDFVPNHTARDHTWVSQHPSYYIGGTEADLAREPGNFARVGKGAGSESESGGEILALGRDPYFPGWPDTFQLNYRHPGLRQAMSEVLSKVARQCDGLRCDMAMLILPEIFERTWGTLANPSDGATPDESSFWLGAISRVREAVPGFLFLAEAYWDLEWTLQRQGFDGTYDKRLYDRLRGQDASAVRDHLRAGVEFQGRSVRFLENHDEPRAVSAFVPWEVHRAAAIITFLAPGIRLFHQGQLDGWRIQPSVHLARRMVEPADRLVTEFYARLLAILQRAEVRQGRWSLMECRPAWSENRTSEQFLAFSWQGNAGERLLIAVNYANAQGQCYVNLPAEEFAGKSWIFRDLVGPHEYPRSGENLIPYGLYLDLPPWGVHVFEVVRRGF